MADPPMRRFVSKRIWEEMYVPDDPRPWVAITMLRLPSELIVAHKNNLNALIYKAEASILRTGRPYLDSFNSARCDLLAHLVAPPEEVTSDEVTVVYRPRGDTSYWLASHVFGFLDHEICVLCDLMPRELTSPKMSIIPLLKCVHRVFMQEIDLKDPMLAAYHRARYLLNRYYLDAKYHAISR
jgi:hypothetical protein